MTKRKKRKPARPRPEQPATPKEALRPPRDWQWWVLSAAIPLVLCASKLDLDLWYDEAYTLDVFVSQPWLEIATDYSAPNNHVLYSLVLRPVYLLSDSEYLLRLPSLLFSAGTLAIVFRLARRWSGLPGGVLATASVGLTQMFLNHTMQVRGYGLSMLLAAWLGSIAVAERPDVWWRRAATIGLVGAAFLYVLPTNLLFFLPLAAVAVAWTAVRDRRLRSALSESAAWGLACLVAGLVYLPILGPILDLGAGHQRASPGGVLVLACQVFSAAARDWLPILPLAALGLAFWIRDVLRRPARRRVVLPLLMLAVLVGPFCLTAVFGVMPFIRNYTPVLPFWGVALGWLLAELLAAAGRLVPAVRSDVVQAPLGLILLASVALPRICTYPARLTEHRRREFAQDGYYDYYAANFHPSEVARYLRQSIGPKERYVICYADADHFPLWHYLRRVGTPLERLDRRAPAGPPIVYVIAPARADYEALSAKSGLPVDLIRRFPLVRDFGYYRLYRSAPGSLRAASGRAVGRSPPALPERPAQRGPSAPNRERTGGPVKGSPG